MKFKAGDKVVYAHDAGDDEISNNIPLGTQGEVLQVYPHGEERTYQYSVRFPNYDYVPMRESELALVEEAQA